MPKNFCRNFLIIFFFFFLFFSLGINKVEAQENHFLIVEVQISGDEADFDYIKIFNPFNEEKDVSGYKLRKRASTGTEDSIRVFPSGTKISAQGFLIWANTKFSSIINADISGFKKLAAKNSIAFFDKDSVQLDAVAWGESVNPFVEGQPFSKSPGKNQQLVRKQENGFYIDTDNNSNDFYLKGTGGEPAPTDETNEDNEQNNSQITIESGLDIEKILSGNQPPMANAGQDVVILTGQTIEFDGSNSYEPENQKIYFFWNFGDGKTSEEIKPKHSYNFPGNYQVVLEVSDGDKSATDDLKATVFPTGIIISEIFPNPKGVDKGKEWVEIYNDNDQIIDISGFGIISKTSKFVFPKNSFIFGKQFLTIRPNFSLTNKSGEIEFVYPNGWRIQKISYSEAKEGQSMVFFSNDFYFSSAPTPGQKNIIITEDKGISQIENENTARSFIVKEANSQTLLKEFDLNGVNSGLTIIQEPAPTADENKNASSSNFSENNIKSGIKAQIGNIKAKDLLILAFPTALGLLFLIFFYFKKHIYPPKFLD
ncbi:MAG: PKD domain-containing protein [bacterium]|nr:PKD domain-containing protein [bacterium]